MHSSVSIRFLWHVIALTCFYVTNADENVQSIPTQKASNYVANVQTTCTQELFNINVTMRNHFKGVIFAKDFSRQCNSKEIHENVVKLSLPTKRCGIRLASKNRDDEEVLFYRVTLVIQMDRHLRQIVDQEVTVLCYLKDNEVKLTKTVMDNIMKSARSSNRVGRMHTDFHADSLQILDEKHLLDNLENAKAWMELKGSGDFTKELGKKDAEGITQVGDNMTLVIKSMLPDNISWRAVDCSAYDGIGDLSQKLLDQNGCPVDELILPELEYSNSPHDPHSEVLRNRRTIVKKTGEELKKRKGDIGKDVKERVEMRYQEAKVHFPAFKFPDRSRLHLSCSLQLCMDECQQIDCSSTNRASRQLSEMNFDDAPGVDANISQNPSRSTPSSSTSSIDAQLSKTAKKDVIIERLEVYNSIEVIAPELDVDGFKSRNASGYNRYNQGANFNSDRTFCMSTSKVTLAFCVLGLIFILASFVALTSLIHTRCKVPVSSYYSRSLFSGSTSTISGTCGESKLIQHDSPSSLHSSRHWTQYGDSF